MEEDGFESDNDDLNSLENLFKRATDFVADNVSSISQDNLLYLYGRYKIATCGVCNEPMPGILQFKNRSKWHAWNNLGSMEKEEAMEQYINKVIDIRPEWNKSCGEENTKIKNRFGPVTSTCLNLDPVLGHDSKTIFDFVKEGNLSQVELHLSTHPTFKDSEDENGLTLLHWACDRGNIQIASYLVVVGADVNKHDKDGQTPLHYASSCGHEEVIKLLLKNGATINVYDADGLTPAEVAYNSAVKELLDMQPV